MGLRNSIRLGAELDMAPIASLQGDSLPRVPGGLRRHPDNLLLLSLTWEGPSEQHLGIIRITGAGGGRKRIHIRRT